MTAGNDHRAAEDDEVLETDHGASTRSTINWETKFGRRQNDPRRQASLKTRDPKILLLLSSVKTLLKRLLYIITRICTTKDWYWKNTDSSSCLEREDRDLSGLTSHFELN